MTQEQKQTLVGLVKTEADNIKLHATQEELNSLDFDTLSPSKTTNCIYGQMTGDCYSWRANELIIQSAERVYNSQGDGIDEGDVEHLNGEPELVGSRGGWYHSPIELFVFINRYLGRKYNERLIDYLKGKTDKLEIDLVD